MIARIKKYVSVLAAQQVTIGRLLRAAGPFNYLPTSPIPYIILWLILMVILFSRTSLHTYAIFSSISSALICAHVLYGGYFLFKKENLIDPLIIFLLSLIYLGLVLFVKYVTYPFLWFLWLEVMFCFAMAFHMYYKYRLSYIYLKEFCNYKLYIETCGILLCILGMFISLILPLIITIVSVLALIFILGLNITIFKKKKLYKMYYPNPNISRNPLVSIVIIAYNEEKYIGKLLESISAQDYSNYEIIVVDDHSTDKTVEIANSFKTKMPLIIIQKDIRGASRSRNYGASHAKGDLILFLDADVILPPRFMSANVGVFIEQKLSIAGIDFVAISDNKIDKPITLFYRHWLKIVQYFNPRGIGFCLLVCTGLHQKVLFDESIIMSEDFDYVKRAVHFGKFRIIEAVRPEVSWRRFQKENRILLILKYLFFEWYRQNIGEIRRKLLPYEFGNVDSQKSCPKGAPD